MNKLIHFLKLVAFELQYKYLFSGSIVVFKSGSLNFIDSSVKIKRSKLTSSPGSNIVIKKGTVISDSKIFVDGELTVEENCTLNKGDSESKLQLVINNGKLKINSFSRIRCKIWIRFGGTVEIGKYTNINEGSEIRSDQMITIGDFCMISYNCMIWDTNTHNIYSDSERRKLTMDHYPKFGHEYEKPNTAPISIGNDCWIGREAAILKGVVIKNSVIVGFRTTISKGVIESNKTIIQQLNYKEILRNN